MVLNTRHAVRNCNGGEAITIPESTIADSRHAIGNVDGGEGIAIIESFIANIRHAVADGGGGKISATNTHKKKTWTIYFVYVF